MSRRTIEIRIRRQDSPGAPARWEQFSIPYQRNLNVISCLMEIQRNPVTRDGARTTPPAWEQNCLENVCGSCSMLVNGRPRQACAVLIDQIAEPVELCPLTKFPVVRDLVVDRSRMFDLLRKVRAWIPIDGTYDLGPGPVMPEEERAKAYEFSRCMTCGCCMEACPQFGPGREFVGPAPLAQVRLFNAHPTGRMSRRERLEAVMGRGGVTDCGNAQNCVKVCPKEIPLLDAIAEVNRQVTSLWLRDLFRS
jgi:succinate dehydrogenase / fumarate reductase iron-sulfur subunit